MIIARGTHIQHYMNNRLILDFHDGHKAALLEGILAFQLHAGNPMWVEFKDVRIRDLQQTAASSSPSAEPGRPLRRLARGIRQLLLGE